VSADKDLLQCLQAEEPGINAVRQVTGGRGSRTITAESMREDMRIRPDQVPAWLALMGDTSDNVKGVAGCGTKTAAKWLRLFGDLEGVIEAAKDPESTLTALQRTSIVAAQEREECNLAMALELVTLRTDLPIDVDAITAPRQPKQLDHDMNDEEEDVADTLPPTETIEAEPVSNGAAFDSTEPPPAMVVRDVTWERSLEPRNMTEAWTLARLTHASRFFSGYGAPEQVMTTILAGRSLGLDAMQSLRSIHIIKGKPSLSAQLMHALCMRHPDCLFFRMVKSSNESATYETHRRGDPEPVSITFTMKDAERARLTGKADSNWSKYPAQMLRARCVADLARAVYADAIHNVYVEGELD
jgi:hypothetical protein